MWQQASKKNEYIGGINQHKIKTLKILICMFIVAFSNSPILHISHHYSGTANITVLQCGHNQNIYRANIKVFKVSVVLHVSKFCFNNSPHSHKCKV